MIDIITLSEKSSWSCPTTGVSFAGAYIPLPTWTSVPKMGGTRVVKTLRSPSDFIDTSKSTYFGGDRTCINNQWDAKFVWDSGIFSLSGYTRIPWNLTRWMSLVCPGYFVDSPKGKYTFSPAQRTRNVCYGYYSGGAYQCADGRPIVEPYADSRLDICQAWPYSYGERDVYLYRWLNVGSFTLCLVCMYSIIVGIGTDDVVAADPKWGVVCYGWHPSSGSYCYSFDGYSGFTNGAFWIPRSRIPGSPSTSDVLHWVDTNVADPYSMLDRAATYVTNLSAAVVGGCSCGYSNTQADFSALKSSLSLISNADDFDKQFVRVTPTEYDWADLCDTALDGCRSLNITSALYLKEFVDYVRMIVNFVQTKRITVPRDIGSAWLSARYGLRLTVNDTKSIYTSVKRAMSSDRRDFSVSHSRSTKHLPCPSNWMDDYTRQLNYKVYYNRKDDPALNFIRTAMDWDIWPTLSNDWDMIPYSFVVDWFVDVQSQLEKLDNSIYEAYLSVLSVLYTEKHTYSYKPELFSSGFWKCVSCDHVFYHRRQSPVLHYAPLRLERGHSSNINIIDGVSLIIQRMIN